jgi:hypothetical protein
MNNVYDKEAVGKVSRAARLESSTPPLPRVP